MTDVVQRPPLWFTVLLASQVVSLLLAFGVALPPTIDFSRVFLTVLFTPIIAAVVVIVFYLPLHALLVVLRISSRAAYVAAALVAITGFHALFTILWSPEATPRELLTGIAHHPVESYVYLIPLVALPLGLLFHALAYTVSLAQPLDWRDGAIVVAGLATLLVLPAMSSLIWLDRPRLAPDDWRYIFRMLVHRYGPTTLCLASASAALVRLRSQRAALALVGVAAIAPLAVALVWLAIQTRPQELSYSVKGRTFVVPLHQDPRAEEVGGFSFDATRRGPFAGRLLPTNPRIYVRDGSLPLAAAVDPHRPADTDIQTSIEGEFAVERYTDTLERAIRVYSNPASRGPITTRIYCQAGFCHHCFYGDGLRYCLHEAPDAQNDWRRIQEHTRALVAALARQP